jgi:hypothetical protein
MVLLALTTIISVVVPIVLMLGVFIWFLESRAIEKGRGEKSRRRMASGSTYKPLYPQRQMRQIADECGCVRCKDIGCCEETWYQHGWVSGFYASIPINWDRERQTINPYAPHGRCYHAGLEDGEAARKEIVPNAFRTLKPRV